MDNKCKLVSVTAPAVPGIETAEDLVVYCARVSNPSNQMNSETGPKLLSYLIKHKHWSPFEMVHATIEIHTSRAIAAQILRHRSFSFQEFSQRYAQATTIEDTELRKQGKTNRQVGDTPFDPNIPCSDALYTCEELASELIEQHNQRSVRLYEKLIDAGVAKECARMALPLATSTTLYMSGSLRSWIHYLQIRTDEHTQKEHRAIALECQKILKEQFPTVFNALTI